MSPEIKTSYEKPEIKVQGKDINTTSSSGPALVPDSFSSAPFMPAAPFMPGDISSAPAMPGK